MTFLDHLSSCFPPAFVPAALMGVAILTTVLLARPRSRALRTGDGGTLQVPNDLLFHKPRKRQAPAALTNPRPPAA